MILRAPDTSGQREKEGEACGGGGGSSKTKGSRWRRRMWLLLPTFFRFGLGEVAEAAGAAAAGEHTRVALVEHSLGGGIPPAGSSHGSTRGRRSTFSSLPASMAKLTARRADLFHFAYLSLTQIKFAPQDGLSHKLPPALHFAAITVATAPRCQLPVKD
ncbi:hypothetical protein E2320_003721 [Naja naja]|nr:hypothetical protein E2320_003721 [Naja naja]